MPSALIIAENTALTTNAYPLTVNPIQPRNMIKNVPVSEFSTLEGPGGAEAPKSWFPKMVFSWPDLVRSNSDHLALEAAFADRQYVKSGIEYFIGIIPADTKDAGFPFWTDEKYIKIRILNVMSAEQPKDTSLDEVIFDLLVTCLWTDAS